MNVAKLIDRAMEKRDWRPAPRANLSLLFSPLLSEEKSLVHAFTTRLGGSTPAPYDQFNLGRHVDDDELRKDALRNREILCQALQIDYTRLCVPGQTHTTNIYKLDRSSRADEKLSNYDAVSTDLTGAPLLLHFADCVPVMIFDRKRKVLSVLHAGWRGTAGGIVRLGVQFMIANFGCHARDMVAAVGPAIGSCCYVTGQDVADNLKTSVKQSDELVITKNGQPYPDLKAINAMQLLEAGVTELDISSYCTACEPQLFYSHRQSGGTTGRQGALACII